MKIKSLLSIFLAGAALFATTANAETRWPNWYVGLHGGWVAGDDYDTTPGADVETDHGFIVGASLGYVPPTTVPFFNQSRFELEYSYRNNSEENRAGISDVDSHSAMLNLIYDFNNDTSWTPYVGAGLGMNHLKLDSESDTVFAWQLMAGLDYEPASLPMTAWGVRYRYFNSQDAKADVLGTPLEMEYDTHSVEATARFRF